MGNQNSCLTESSSSSDEDVEEVQNYDAPFHKLDDYTVQHIFSYIPLLDRIKLEAVCRRWKRLIVGMLRKLEHLDIPNGIPCEFPKEFRNVTFLKKLFKRANLKKLTLQGNKISQVSHLVETVVYECPDLEELRFYRVQFHGFKLHMLSRLKKLKRLALHDCDPINDAGLKFILKDRTALTHLELTNCRCVTGDFLKYVHAPLEVLNLACQQKFEPWSIVAYADRFAPTLKHLNISFWSKNFFLGTVCKEILQKLPNLESFAYAKSRPGFGFDLIECLMEMKNIVSLDVSHNARVNDEFLEDLVVNCPHLKSLDVSGGEYRYMKEDEVWHVSYLSDLPNLRWLNLSFMVFLKSEEIQLYASKCPPIEQLYIVGLPRLQNDDVKSLLRSCQRLKYLDVSDCREITDEIVTAAVEAMEVRIDDQPLQLVVGGTKIKKPSEGEPPLPSHPLLTVCYDNNSSMMDNFFFLGANRFTFYGAKDDSEDDDEDAPSVLEDLICINVAMNAGSDERRARSVLDNSSEDEH